MNRRIVLISGIFLVSGISTVLFLGYWPAIVVDGVWILFRDVKINMVLALSYYSNVADAYDTVRGNGETVIDNDALRAGVHSELIERTLIHEKLHEEIGDEVLRGMVEDRIGDVRGDILTEDIESLYGVGQKIIEAHVFVPQAERDIMRGRMFLRGENFEEWLSQTRKTARVTVFIPGAE